MTAALILAAALATQAPDVPTEVDYLAAMVVSGYTDADVLAEIASWAWSNGMTTNQGVAAIDNYVIGVGAGSTPERLPAWWYDYWNGWARWFVMQPTVPLAPPVIPPGS